MSNEDKKRPDSPNRNPNFCPDPIITMWVKLEGNPDFEEFIVDKNDYPNNPNVHNLKTLLLKRFVKLANITEEDIQIITLSDPATPKFFPRRLYLNL